MIIYSIESVTYLHGSLGTAFERVKFCKFISLPLRVKISNKIEDVFEYESLYNKGDKLVFRPKYQTITQINEAIDACDNFEKNIVAERINYLKVATDDQSFEKYNICNPYNRKVVKKWSKKHVFPLSPEITALVLDKQAFSLELKKRMAIIPKDYRNIDLTATDPRSGLPNSTVFESLLMFEIFFVIQTELWDFLLAIGFNQAYVLDYIEPLLRKFGAIKNDQTIQVLHIRQNKYI
jgi:hypothetical protein